MKPWMDEDEIQKIVSFLKPNHKVFEWGCGGSTLFFSQYVSLYRSIEHEKYWYNKILRLTQSNTELIYCSNNDQYYNYINIISSFNDHYDIILIDGRCRLKCAIAAKTFLKPNGILFVHDFFTRPYYSAIADYYQLLESDSIKHTTQTLGVFHNGIRN